MLDEGMRVPRSQGASQNEEYGFLDNTCKRTWAKIGAEPAQSDTPSEPRPSGVHTERAEWREDVHHLSLGTKG
jgi:hypothetical protein